MVEVYAAPAASCPGLAASRPVRRGARRANPSASGIASALFSGAGQALSGAYRAAALHTGIFGLAGFNSSTTPKPSPTVCHA